MAKSEIKITSDDSIKLLTEAVRALVVSQIANLIHGIEKSGTRVEAADRKASELINRAKKLLE